MQGPTAHSARPDRCASFTRNVELRIPATGPVPARGSRFMGTGTVRRGSVVRCGEMGTVKRDRPAHPIAVLLVTVRWLSWRRSTRTGWPKAADHVDDDHPTPPMPDPALLSYEVVPLTSDANRDGRIDRYRGEVVDTARLGLPADGSSRPARCLRTGDRIERRYRADRGRCPGRPGLLDNDPTGRGST